MRKVFTKVLLAIGVAWFSGLFVLGFLAYFVTSAGPCDGLGRPLAQAPMLMRIFFGQERLWAGWGWFATDMVLFWGSIAGAVRISKLLDRDSHA